MIAQLSQSVERGSPSSSIMGVRCAGFIRRKSGSPVFPHASSSSKSRSAARTKIRTVRLLTLGFSTWSFIAAMASSRSVRILGRPVVRQRRPRSRDQELEGVGEMDLGDVGIATLYADPVRLEQHVRMSVPERRLESIGRKLDQQAQRIVEVDGVHEAAVLDAAVADPPLIQALDGLAERRLGEREGEVVNAAGVGADALRIRRPLLVREDGDQPAVARVEV